MTMQSVPPRVAGISVGNTEYSVRSTLGDPERKEAALGMTLWHYAQRQMTILWRDGESGVHGVVVAGEKAGDVDGVKIGDTREASIRLWGVPARIRQDGRYLDFVGAHWVLTVEVWHDTVVQMTLMRGSATPPKK